MLSLGRIDYSDNSHIYVKTMSACIVMVMKVIEQIDGLALFDSKVRWHHAL